MDTAHVLAARFAASWPHLYWVLTVIGACYVGLALMGGAGIGGCGGTIVACDAAAYYYADGYRPIFTPQYGYSPAFLTALAPVRLLPFESFVWGWAGLHIVALLWLRAGWFLAIPGVNEGVIRGNVTVFIAVAIVLALRYPSAWAFPLLTKVLPGVGIVWHLVRREWAAAGRAVAVVTAIVAIGFVLRPALWLEWLDLLLRAGAGTAESLIPRLGLAVGVVGFAAATSRAWLLPFGALLAWSFITPPVFMVLAAVPRLAGYSSKTEMQPDQNGRPARLHAR